MREGDPWTTDSSLQVWGRSWEARQNNAGRGKKQGRWTKEKVRGQKTHQAYKNRRRNSNKKGQWVCEDAQGKASCQVGNKAAGFTRGLGQGGGTLARKKLRHPQERSAALPLVLFSQA